MWSTSTRLGCAIAPRDGEDYLVCDYYPPGNIVGRRPFNC